MLAARGHSIRAIACGGATMTSTENASTQAAAEPQPRWLGWTVAIASALVLAVLASSFLPQQSLWVDETTQLRGMTLDPVELVRWLCG
jgi:hypothetical protein